MLQPVRGTHDLLPQECRQYRAIANSSRLIAQRYGYEEIETPIFEFSSVFLRMGEASDVVTKETYTFQDRGGQEITLRPEGTAGIMRAIISNGLTQKTPLKYYSCGPMFRYERPQKGRYRQFTQVGVELVGVAEPLGDVEVIALAEQFLKEIGLTKGISLEINTLGDQESRNLYRTALVTYLNDFRTQLSPESQIRLDLNPLRILDSKDVNDRKLLENCPVFRDYLNAESEDFFANVLKKLDLLGITYTLNYQIVRGLDYYCHTAFEFVSHQLGAQGTVLAGGRYDGLISQLGGPNLAGVGWAAGLDRLVLLAEKSIDKPCLISIIPVGDTAESQALQMAQDLRQEGLNIDLGYSGSLSKRMKKANSVGASWAVIFGDDEIKSQKVAIRDLKSGLQVEVAFDKISDYLQSKIQ
ncbi:MAG: histidine--tRNA ligase [Alphaproteobacteria bacterium]|nr:histidine--tRNA ligase [Alphaproteobacteria bacterium]